MSRVYVSLPLSGPTTQAGHELLAGAQRALEGSDHDVTLVVLDSFGARRERQAVANAEQAVADGEALAYLGDFHSSQVRETAPILGEVGLLQVAPVATQMGLGGPTLFLITPHDGVGAGAIADWLADASVRRVLVVHDYDVAYGVPVGAMCVEAALARGLGVRSRPVWDAHERPADDLNGAEAVVYAGVAGSGAIGLWSDLHAANPDLWLLGTEDWHTTGSHAGWSLQQPNELDSSWRHGAALGLRVRGDGADP